MSLWAVTPTEDAIARLAPKYGGMFHGIDKEGIADIEFDDVYAAASFVGLFDAADTTTIRDGMKVDQPFNSRVVVQMRVIDGS